MSPNFIKFFFKIICTFLLSQSKLSVSEIHQSIFSQNYMHVSFEPIKIECLRISSNCFFSNHMHVSSKPIKSESLRISSFFFQIICTFLLSQSKVSVSEFHQVIFQIICTFLLSLSKVGVSEFHIFFNFFQVSLRPIKTECPKIFKFKFESHSA